MLAFLQMPVIESHFLNHASCRIALAVIPSHSLGRREHIVHIAHCTRVFRSFGSARPIIWRDRSSFVNHELFKFVELAINAFAGLKIVTPENNHAEGGLGVEHK